jgi:hypothetical protein
LFRIVFVVVLLVQLDGGYGWNWWLVFAPFGYASYQSFAELQQMAMEKDPALFAPTQTTTQPNSSGKTDYGAVGENAAATPSDAQRTTLSPEVREEVKAQVMASSSKLCSNKCCSQGFLLAILFLLAGKLQGGWLFFLSDHLAFSRCGKLVRALLYWANATLHCAVVVVCTWC